MNPKRMTVEELNELNPTVDNPVELERENGKFVGRLGKISVLSKVVRGRFFVQDMTGGVDILTSHLLDKYPSLKQPNIETLYECFGCYGDTEWRFKDGAFPDFTRMKKDGYDPATLIRKTGRTLKIDMDTFEIMGEEYGN